MSGVRLRGREEIFFGAEFSASAGSSGAMVEETMKLTADDVQGVIIAGSGHLVAEQAPEQLLAALTQFLAPYRDASSGVAAVGARS